MAVANGPPGSGPAGGGAPPTIPEAPKSVRAVPVSDLEWDDDDGQTEQDVTLVLSLGAEAAQKALRSAGVDVGARRPTPSKPNGKKATFLDEPTIVPTGSSPTNGLMQPLRDPPVEIEDAATAVHRAGDLDALLKATSGEDLGATRVVEDLGATMVRDDRNATITREDLRPVTLRDPHGAVTVRPAAPPSMDSQGGLVLRPNVPPAIDSQTGEEIATVSLSEVTLEDPTVPYPALGARLGAAQGAVAPPAASRPSAPLGARAALPPLQLPPALPAPALPPLGGALPPATPPPPRGGGNAPPVRAPLAAPVPPQPGISRPTGNRSRWARMGTLQGGITAPTAGQQPGDAPAFPPPAAQPPLRAPTLQGLARGPAAPSTPQRTEPTSPRVEAVDLTHEEDEEEATLIFAKPVAPSTPAPAPNGSAPRLPAPIPAAGMPAPHAPPSATPPPGFAAPAPSAAPLAAATPAPAPPPPPAASLPPLTDVQRAMQASLPPVTPRTNRMGAVLGGVAFVVSATLAVFLLLPRKGRLVVEVAADAPGPVGAAEVFVDGRKVCERAPCVVSELSPGPKSVRVIAPGFVTPDVVIETVEAGQEAHVKVPLRTMAPARGSVRIAGGQAGVKVFIDGNDRGPLPQTFSDLTPGTHALRFDGGERLVGLERTVDVVGGQVADVGDVRLKVKKGRASITLATKGADVRLYRKDKGEKSAKTLDGPWPVTVDVEVAEGWRLVASKKSFDPFSRDLTFDDGNPDAQIRIELQKPGAEPPAPVAAAEPAKVEPRAPEPKSPEPKVVEPKTPEPKAPPPEKPTPEPPAKKPEAPVATGTGTLNVNSLPLSNVLIDGRPYGSTPKTDISLPAGSHTVTFVHPELGRKSVTVTVEAGKSATAAVRFKKPEE